MQGGGPRTRSVSGGSSFRSRSSSMVSLLFTSVDDSDDDEHRGSTVSGSSSEELEHDRRPTSVTWLQRSIQRVQRLMPVVLPRTEGSSAASSDADTLAQTAADVRSTETLTTPGSFTTPLSTAFRHWHRTCPKSSRPRRRRRVAHLIHRAHMLTWLTQQRTWQRTWRYWLSAHQEAAAAKHLWRQAE